MYHSLFSLHRQGTLKSRILHSFPSFFNFLVFLRPMISFLFSPVNISSPCLPVYFTPQFLCGPFLSLLSFLQYLALRYLTSVYDFPSSLNFQNTIFSLCVLNTLAILFQVTFPLPGPEIHVFLWVTSSVLFHSNVPG